jgi:hypothetical protein
LLFAQTNSGAEPVRVVEASPLALVYEMKRAELFTGRVFEFRFEYRLTGARDLEAVERVELNGVVLREQQFSVRR